MRLVSRLAPPAAIATLAAAALAIPVASASADQAQCRAGMLANANQLMLAATQYALAGDLRWFQRSLQGVEWSVSAYSKC